MPHAARQHCAPLPVGFTATWKVSALASNASAEVERGAALFFLLLLSLSEHLAFGGSYALAAVACVALLGFYGAHMLGGAWVGAGFGAGIGALYLLLQMEQTALVIGSLMLFGALALVMVLTRRVDWYAMVAPRPASIAG